MWLGGALAVAVAAAACLVASAADGDDFALLPRLAAASISEPVAKRDNRTNRSSRRGGSGEGNSSDREVGAKSVSLYGAGGASEPSHHEGLSLTPAQEGVLRRLLRSPEDTPLDNSEGFLREPKGVAEEVRWRCLVEWLNARTYRPKKDQRTCDKEVDKDSVAQKKTSDECVPLLLLVVPALCNGTQSCVNLTEASLEELLHRYVLWERKKKRHEEADDAVIYIVVVLAFYSFGIVFMIANFVRQEQRELEETKMYKQYVKVARDRWLTTRGNMANKLALQALNTFNAVPQTTDENKVTFV